MLWPVMYDEAIARQVQSYDFRDLLRLAQVLDGLPLH